MSGFPAARQGTELLDMLAGDSRDGGRPRLFPAPVVPLLAVCASFLAALLLAAGALAAGRGPVVVELQQNNGNDLTYASTFPVAISGTDGATRQEYKFQRRRVGKHFTYVVANLQPGAPCLVELSFVEHEFHEAGSRRFNVYVQSALVRDRLDIFAGVGADSACQVTVGTEADSKGLLAIAFRSDEPGCAGLATVSTIRVLEGAGGADIVEIDASASRHTAQPPAARYNTGDQDVFEAILGRLGSRASMGLVPQRLGWRFSPLGTWTADLSELVLALKHGRAVRALPFTGRFPLFEEMSQSQTMTSQEFACSSPSMPFRLTVRFVAPFYPRDEKVSGAPFFCLEVTVENRSKRPASGTLMFARPHKEEFASAAPSRFSAAGATGVTSGATYCYCDETVNSNGARTAAEALCVPIPEETGVEFRGTSRAQFADFSRDNLWGWASPGGYPAGGDPANPVFSFYPRGYTGCLWKVKDLAPGAARTKHFILAGHISGRVLTVRNPHFHDDTYRFRYNRHFAGVRDVCAYAASNLTGNGGVLAKSAFFDSTVSSDEYLWLDPPRLRAVRDLFACSFQSFLSNTWWTRSSAGRDWFSVWEGTWMRLQATVDVEYNHAWFYLQFWPELLARVLDQWLWYLKSNDAGVYLPHDVGIQDEAAGQVYDHDMPVEENLNYILLLYRYWKASGDSAYVRGRIGRMKEFARFIMNCDTNGNGLPDRYSETTFDDGTPALERGKDQSYLGFKCLAAFRAAAEMALGPGSDPAFASACRGQAELIGQTLGRDAWLGDHFAVCLDGDVERADRDAYSIHTGNGLLYLLGGSREPGVTAEEARRLGRDIAEATSRTWGTYGSRHTSYEPGRMWISANVWRDALAGYFGAAAAGPGPPGNAGNYWALEKYLATNLSGCYWDGMIYGGSGRGAGVAGAHPPAESSGTTRGAGSGDTGRAPPDGNAGGLAAGGASQGGAALVGTVPAPAGLIAERPVYFNYHGAWSGGHDVVGTAGPSSTFYFAEGSTRPGFDSYLCVQNPGAGAARVRITYMLGTGSTKVQELEVPAHSRSTVRAVDVLGSGDGASYDFAAKVESLNGAGIVAERPVYFDYGGWTGGHDVAGATSPSSEHYFAEGTTRPGFDPYLCVMNPGKEPTRVNVTYMLGDGRVRSSSLDVGAHARSTVRVRDVLGSGDDPSHDFSMKVRSSPGAVVAERPVYFNYHGAWSGGHDVVGAAGPALAFYFAEGTTRPGFDPYLCVMNPGDTGSEVRITYMRGDGRNFEQTLPVSAHSRSTVRVRDVLGSGDDPSCDFSARVMAVNGTGIVVERPQYFDYRGRTGGHDVVGATASSSTLYFAEGTARPGFDSYICLQNPGPDPLDARVTYMLGDGGRRSQEVRVGARSRSTVDVGAFLGRGDSPAHDFSAKVEVLGGTAGTPLMSCYPRGTACFALVDSAAGLVVDNPGDGLYYRPPAAPLRIPVWNRADWGAADEDRRVPTLFFPGGATAPVVTNRSLLPGTVEPAEAAEMREVEVTGSPLDPWAGGRASVSYRLSSPSMVRLEVWDGARPVRVLLNERQGAGKHRASWDGKDASGRPVDDGEYCLKIDAAPDNGPAPRPATAGVSVNSSVPGLGTDWYFAEGYTGSSPQAGDFTEYLLMVNPGADAARVKATLMPGDGRAVSRTFAVAGGSRLTVRVDDILPSSEVSLRLESDRPVAAERSMYFGGGRAGHGSVGANSPSRRWYLAEGCTAPGFDEYVLVQNPDGKAADVRLSFMTTSGPVLERDYTVAPHSRFTVHVNDLVPSQEVSVTVEATSPVVVERSQYLNNMTAGTCTIAARSLSKTWFAAEGCTAAGFEEYLLIANPGATVARAKLFFLDGSGVGAIRDLEVPARSRRSVAVGDVLPESDVSVKVRSSAPVVVERAMYWNGRSDGHASIASPSGDDEWYLPDCYTAGGYESWALVMNPSGERRRVKMTLMDTEGKSTAREYELGAGARFTVDLGSVLPSREFSARFSADGPVIVEKSVYFSGRSGGTCTTGVRGAGGD